jgi:hypothetical protein
VDAMIEFCVKFNTAKEKKISSDAKERPPAKRARRM